MAGESVVRRVLVISDPAPWIPPDRVSVAAGELLVERATEIEDALGRGGGRDWDVVAFRVARLRPLAAADVLSRLRSFAPDATFLPVTDAADPREAVAYLKQGAYEYLEEPLAPEAFLQAVGEAIENRDTFREILDLNRALEAQQAQLLREKAELERRNWELEAVSRLARALSSTLETKEIREHIGAALRDALRFGRAWVGLLDSTGAWEDNWDVTGGPETKEGPRWSLRDGKRQPWIRRVLREGRLLRASAAEDHRDLRGTALEALHRNPFAKVPMVAGGRVVGSITVESAEPGAPISDGDLALLGIFADAAAMALENARLYQTMVELSVRDELTGLYNRRHLLRQLQAEWVNAERHGTPLAVLMLDIDHFKDLNDGNDHLTGDAALRRLGAALLRNTRGTDTVARYGGEEFAVVLPRTPRPNALLVAEKLRGVVARTGFEGEETVPGGKLTVSVGVAAYPEAGVGPEDLLEKADRALYQAKAAGRNQVASWEHREDRAAN